jgi:Tfp pilus assembly protein PilF
VKPILFARSSAREGWWLTESGSDKNETSPFALAPKAERHGARRGGAILACLCLPLLVAVLYAPGVPREFVGGDEQAFIRDNPFLRSIAGLTSIWTPTDAGRKFYPVTYTSHWIEFHLWGVNPAGYYVVNVALHALCTLLVFFLLREMGAGPAVALLTAGLFAAHPMQVASVAWLGARKNMLSTAFALLAFILYLRRQRAAAPGWPVLPGALFAAALLSKTTAIGLVASAMLADWVLNRRRLIDAIMPLLPFAVVVGGGLIFIDSAFERAVGAGNAEPPLLRPLAASGALWFYVGKLIWPFGLAPRYPEWAVSFSPIWIAALLGVVITGVGVWLARRRIPALSVWGVGHFFVNLLPSLGLVSYGYLKHSPVGDQYVYAAAPGLFLVVGSALERGVRGAGRFALPAIGCLLIAGLGAFTFQRAAHWRGSVEYWSHVLDQNPTLAAGRRRLADAYMTRGRTDEAIREYEWLLEADPEDGPVHNNLGAALESLGRSDEALLHFRAAARDGNMPDAQVNVAVAQRNLGTLSAQIARLQMEIGRRPDDARARFALAAGLAVGGRRAEAARHVERLLQDRPNDARVVYQAGFLLRTIERNDEAADAFRRALELARAQDLGDLWYQINRDLAGLH